MKTFFKSYKQFFVSFSISMLILGSMLLICYGYLSFKNKEQAVNMQANDIPINNYYNPTVKDNLTLIFMACEQENSNPSSYFLMYFNVIPNTCTLIEVPKDTYASYGNMNKTIDEFYNYGGMTIAANAISNLFSLNSDTYVKMDITQIKNFCDYFSGFTFDLKEDIQTDLFSFYQGKQSMDGLRIASLILDDKFGQKSSLISSFLNLQLNKEVPKTLDNFYDFFYKNSATNLSRLTLDRLNKPIIRFFRNPNKKFLDYKLETVQKNDLLYPNSNQIKEITDKIKSDSVEPVA